MIHAINLFRKYYNVDLTDKGFGHTALTQLTGNKCYTSSKGKKFTSFLTDLDLLESSVVFIS
jgi:hypothetical protein